MNVSRSRYACSTESHSAIQQNTILRYSFRPDAAFTLIELILAIAIMAIVLVVMNGVLFTALRLRESTDRVVGESLPLQQALATLRRDLQNAVPPTADGVLTGSFKVGGVTSLGEGQPVEIEFYTADAPLTEKDPWGDVQKVTYGLRPSSDRMARGRDLYRGVTRNLLATITPQPDDQWLLSNVESIEFSCYDGSQWRNYWDTTVTDTNLPIAVRVRVLLDNPSDNSATPQPVEILVPIDSQSRTNQSSTDTSTGF